jgi:hypothetical protein
MKDAGIDRCPGSRVPRLRCRASAGYRRLSPSTVTGDPCHYLIHFFHRHTTPTLESIPLAQRPGLGCCRFGGHKTASGAHPPTPFTSFPQAYSQLRLENAKHVHPSCSHLLSQWQTVPTSHTPFSFPARRAKTSVRMRSRRF